MKKLLVLSAVIALSTTITFAATTNLKSSFKNAIKQDIQSVKNDVNSQNKALKEAVKKDIQNSANAKTSAAQAKKAEKIKQIDSKLTSLNKELASVKANKQITETERTLRVNSLERQIRFYNEQKKALN